MYSLRSAKIRKLYYDLRAESHYVQKIVMRFFHSSEYNLRESWMWVKIELQKIDFDNNTFLDELSKFKEEEYLQGEKDCAETIDYLEFAHNAPIVEAY